MRRDAGPAPAAARRQRRPPDRVPSPVAALITPGMRVRHPDRPDWGTGQVQSVIGTRVTVNFEHAGKLLINAAVVALEPAEDDAGPTDPPPPTTPGARRR